MSSGNMGLSERRRVGLGWRQPPVCRPAGPHDGAGMTDTDIDSRACGSGPRRLTPILFAVAIFTSASLVFVVQPMVTKLVLPMLGGSPSVWNTSMVFFQTALLAGYAYAHAPAAVKAMQVTAGDPSGAAGAAALFLPLQSTAGWAIPIRRRRSAGCWRPWPCRWARRSRSCRRPRPCCRPGTPGSAPAMPTARTPMSCTPPPTSAASWPCCPIRS
jgi:hypothetical protein